MKYIELTKKAWAIVDDKDYDYLVQWKWHLSHSGYAARAISIKGKYKTIFMHNIILDTPKGMFPDHVDRNRLNNQRSNLRICTKQQNCRNKNVNIKTASGFRGVTKHLDKWRARIEINDKKIHLGLFINSIDAARAYNNAALKHFGNFAVLNKIS